MADENVVTTIGVTTSTKELFDSAMRKVSYQNDHDYSQDEFILWMLKKLNLD